ncbi:hypothetical protein EYZ11_002683 [Aspergillus tanneri]|uniref:Uncharacterized protein n=1 Tax=Aspergillus tanneri TaxID=1220188 RepID=A0A4S3JQU7_9EURO|nr:hypothetical protein EYZ11_002683 [Aspergillus tanneri]
MNRRFLDSRSRIQNGEWGSLTRTREDARKPRKQEKQAQHKRKTRIWAAERGEKGKAKARKVQETTTKKPKTGAKSDIMAMGRGIRKRCAAMKESQALPSSAQRGFAIARTVVGLGAAGVPVRLP